LFWTFFNPHCKDKLLKSPIYQEYKIALAHRDASIKRRNGVIQEKNEMISDSSKIITEKDDIIANQKQIIANHAHDIRRLSGLIRNKEGNARAKDESRQRLQKRLDAEIAASQSMQRNLDRQIHDLKTAMFQKNEEVMGLQALVRQRCSSCVASSGPASGPAPLLMEGKNISKGAMTSPSEQIDRNNGAGDMKEAKTDTTSKDVDRFLDQMLLDRAGSDKSALKVESDVEVVVVQGRKRNLSEGDEEQRKKADVKKIKQESEE
jgi:hypothetical protein